MKTLKLVAGWLLVAFLFGACLTIGTKTVNHLWPQEITVKHVHVVEG